MKNTDLSVAERLKRAFICSLQGFKRCFLDEQAFRQEVYFAFALLPIPFFLDLTTLERLFMIFLLFFVLVTELLNTGVEAVADQISVQYQDLIKKAKDVASAALLLSLTITGITWLVILAQFF